MNINEYNNLDWKERFIEDTRGHYDPRDEFEVDRARLIHSPCFRRLQGKTQVIGMADGDYHRTRLTHTLEVSQVGRGIAQRLRKDNKDKLPKGLLPSNELIEAISFAHDIGHPPFGHNGEVALNYMMRDHGGFEGNGQSLRQIARLEKRAVGEEECDGLNLTRRTLLGILKYPRAYSEVRRTQLPPPTARFPELKRDDWKPPKSYMDTEQSVVDWILKPLSTDDRTQFIQWKQAPNDSKNGQTQHKSLDCSIMELADDISYAIHDCEDGIVLGFIKQKYFKKMFDSPDKYPVLSQKGIKDRKQLIVAWEKWRTSDRAEGSIIPSLEEMAEHLFGLGGFRRKAISHIIGSLIHSVELKECLEFENSLLQYQAVLPDYAQTILNFMKGVTMELIINSPVVQVPEYRGRIIVLKIFDAISSDPEKLLNEKYRSLYRNENDEAAKMRTICDYIAGMTDSFAVKYYNRLYVPDSGSLFDRV